MSDEITAAQLMRDVGLERKLKALGFSRRTISGILYGTEIKTVEELRSRPWGGKREEGTLCCELMRAPNMGPRGLAEVQAFRRGETDLKKARPEADQTIGVRLQSDMLADLDAWIAAQPVPITRPQAIRAFILEGLKRKSRSWNED